MLKNPKAAADVFAKSMLNGIKSVGSFAKSIFTVGIPAVAKFRLEYAQICSCGGDFICDDIVHRCYPCRLGLLRCIVSLNPITWIVLGIVAAVAAVVVGVTYLWKWFSKLNEQRQVR